MNTYTDTQLKRALAKMLPETIRWCDSEREVLDTELLRLCWLVEGTLNQDQLDDYDDQVFNIMNTPKALPIHAIWQQKVIALAKVKGIII
jgi:hypothetical protein